VNAKMIEGVGMSTNYDKLMEKIELTTHQDVLMKGVEVECLVKKFGELPKLMMNFKLEIKLGQLFRICPRLKKMMEKFLLKIQKTSVANICKITTIKVEDFDKVVLVVQV
jgi:hypothetical protein